MAELKMVSPLLDNMELVQSLSNRGGSAVYLVKSSKSGQNYVLKHLSVPESQRQVDALLYTGAAASEEDAQKYYAAVAADYQTELETMEKLSDSPNLCCYRSYQIVPKEGQVGYDVYLLAEQRKTLAEYLEEGALTQRTAVELGLDLCGALNELRGAGLIHRDVKPTNIFLSSQGHFQLGDLGIAKLDELKYCSMPESMLSSYSPPELFSLLGTIEPTCDLYAVGLILYRIFNGNHGPFEDEKTGPKDADKLRVTGQALPAPMFADYELAEILLKACAFAPQDRYQTPDELKAALSDYARRNELGDEPITPPIVADPEPIDLTEAEAEEEEAIEPAQMTEAEEPSVKDEESPSPDDDMLSSLLESVHRDLDRPSDAPARSQPEQEDGADDDIDDAEEDGKAERPLRRGRKGSVLRAVVAAVLFLAVAAAGVYFLYLKPNTLVIDGIKLVDRNAASVTVHVDCSEADGAFDLVCADDYGVVARQSYRKGQDTVFIELSAGTQYTVSVEPQGKQRIRGESTLAVSTMGQARILSFTATPQSVTQAQLDLTLAGDDPGMWTVRYFAPDDPEQKASFTGHTAAVANLKANTEYTFILEAPVDMELVGETQATLSTVPSVDILELNAAVSSSTAILSWTFTGEEPESWTVSINGPDGYSDTQVVNAPTVTFEELTSGTEYEVILSAPGMLQDVKANIRPTVTTLTDFSANQTDDAIRLTWACEVDPARDNWTLTYGLKNVPEFVPVSVELDSPDGFSIPLSNLLPDAEYEATLELSGSEALEGVSNVLSFRTPKPARFKSYGFDKAYIGLYLCPEGDNWGIKDLKNGRTRYTVGEKLAYALESIAPPQASDDPVEILLILRDQEGNILDLTTVSRKWNDMWADKLTFGSFPNALSVTGMCTIEIYYNGLQVIAQGFTVDEAAT